MSVESGDRTTRFGYDGLGRCVLIESEQAGTGVSRRRLVWDGDTICAERTADGAITKRFFAEGVAVMSGAAAGLFYYTRDHLGSIREVTDAAGAVRARYAYDPYGRRTRVDGDLDADLGFAGMFSSTETGLALTRYRAYDPDLGRWLSRDLLELAELRAGPNLYAYVDNDPLNPRIQWVCTARAIPKRAISRPRSKGSAEMRTDVLVFLFLQFRLLRRQARHGVVSR